ncbi:hypothetical protein GCM10009814_20650 [Lapillicoccus jejuensis]
MTSAVGGSPAASVGGLVEDGDGVVDSDVDGFVVIPGAAAADEVVVPACTGALEVVVEAGAPAAGMVVVEVGGGVEATYGGG